MERLHSERLLLEPLTRDDYDWLSGLYADPEVMRFIGSGVRTGDAARANLEWHREHGEKRGFGYWVLRDRGTGERLGGIMLMIRQEGAAPELGFLLAAGAWGRGVATEAARAVLDHALGALGLAEVQAFTDPQNAASMAVLRKAGLRDCGVAPGPYGTPDRKFRLSREVWVSQGGLRPPRTFP